MNIVNNSYLVTDTDALCSNVVAIEKTLSGHAQIIPVLKCDAYGLGLSITAPVLAAMPQIHMLALAHISEGIALRSVGVKKDTLILGNPLPHALRAALENDLTLTVGRLNLLPQIAKVACEIGIQAKVQIKIETGLHRTGVLPGEQLEALLGELREAGERVVLTGVYSHFADTADETLCRSQAELYLRGVDQTEHGGFSVAMRHICDSAASEYFPEYHFDAVRLGRRLFWDNPEHSYGNIRECASWRSFVTGVYHRFAGEKLGYGGVYTLSRDTDVAVIGVGYGDGLYLPLVEKHGCVLIRGRRCPLLACCMDQCMADVTGMDVLPGEEVTFFGRDRAGNELSAQEIAGFSGANEACALTSALSPRVARAAEKI